MLKLKKLTLLMVIGSACEVNSHDFINSTGATVVASYDLSGSEIWHSYFSVEHKLLAQPVADSQRDFIYINHPRYTSHEMPQHRLVCDLGRGQGGGDNDQDRCKDEFPHVHVDDFQMGRSYAIDLCASFGPGVVPDFHAPSTFVGFDKQPASSHHYHYNLAQGLTFDCVALATY